MMKRKLFESLGMKSMVILGIILTVVFMLITFINIADESRALLKMQSSAAQQFGDSVLVAMRWPMLTGEQQIVQLQFDEYAREEGVSVIHLIDAGGIIRRSTDPGLIGKRSRSKLEFSNKEVYGFERRIRNGKIVFSKIVPIYNEPKCYICHGQRQKVLGHLRLAFDWEQVLGTLKSVRRKNMTISFLGLLAITLSAGLFLLRTVIRPIEDLEAGMLRAARGNLSQKLKVKGRDELGSLTGMFNEMTAQLGNLIEEEKKLRLQEQAQARQLANSVSLLNATLESTIDGILVVDNQQKIRAYNKQFLKLWRIPEEIAASGADEALLHFVKDQLQNPRFFLEKIRYLYAHPEEESFDILEFKDGRIFERFSLPHKIEDEIAGRVWDFRDVTEKKTAELELRKKMAELEKFNRFVVGRELRMKELKNEIDALKLKLKKNEKNQI